MDMPNADLYHKLLAQQLNRPAIIAQDTNFSDRFAVSLERIATTAFIKYYKDFGQILSELLRSTYNVPYPNGEESEPLNELRFDATTGHLIALSYYYRDANNHKLIDKIIYRSREGLILVITYKNRVSEMEWHKPKKISKIYLDVKGFFAQQLEDALAYHKRLEKWREEQRILKEQRKDEEGLVLIAFK